MSRWVRLFLLAIAFSSGVAQEKKRVAVLDFDYAAVQPIVSATFGTNVDVGKEIAGLVVQDLVQGGVYSVIEREKLDKILAEENFSNSDRANLQTAVKLARLLGVDAIVVGTVTHFGKDDKETNVRPGQLGGITGRFGIGGISNRKSKAVVDINARLVSTETAEILSVATGKGESTHSGSSLIGSSTSMTGDGSDMTSKRLADSLLGEAVQQAARSLAAQLDQRASSLPTKKLKVEGLVADATNGTLVMNLGSKAGLKVGDHLEVRRIAREIKDPTTGIVIRRLQDKVGEVTITDVDENSSVGAYAGASPAKVGDIVASAQ